VKKKKKESDFELLLTKNEQEHYPRGKNSLVRAEAMEGAVFQAKGHDTNTLALVHDQIKGKVLHKEGGVVLQSLSIESVQESMSGAVSSSSTAVCLSTCVAWDPYSQNEKRKRRKK